MVEHLSGDRLQAYARRRLPSEELLAADDHLSSCPECRAQIPESATDAALAKVRAAAVSLEPTAHLRYEDLAAWVDGSLGEVERELAQAHLEACGRCTAEAHDLSAARAELRPRHEYKPARRLTEARGGASRWHAPLQAAAVLVFALGLWAFLRGSANNPARVDPLARVSGLDTPVVALVDGGHRIGLDREGRVTGLERLPADVQARVATALSSRRIASGDVSALVGAPQQLMGAATPAAPFRLVSPVGTMVESTTPTLRWLALNGATSYQATVLDRDLVMVAESPELKNTEWRVPKGLERGRTYVWQVVARKGHAEVVSPAPPEPDARFGVLAAVKAETLARARATGESQLVLGVLYAEAGLMADAERELLALKQANPESPVPPALLASLARRER